MPKQDKFKNKLCDSKMTFEDCELTILRHAVDNTEKQIGIEKVNNEDVKNMLQIVESFIKRKKLICYGGTAINNILPESEQFYNKQVEIPDYDFFSDNPIKHAKELADIYHKAGYKEVEAKSGVHYGTFKVFVNYMSIADITFLHPEIFKKIGKEALVIDGLRYAPPNFLRMAMYLELSRPLGDISRWEKVYKRLSLLNKNYPLKTKNCKPDIFSFNENSPTNELNTLIRNTLIKENVVFFGGYSNFLYSRYMSSNEQNMANSVSEFDVLSEDPEKTANNIKEILKDHDYKDIKVIKHKEIGEIVPLHYEVQVKGKTHLFAFQPIACHNYNQIRVKKKKINVATIDTILSLYLAFLYTDMPYYNHDRLLCLSDFLLKVIEKNKLNDRGILKRFAMICYGKQKTLEDLRSEKNDKFKEFTERKLDRESKEYNMWFLKYVPKSSRNITKKKKENTKSKTVKNLSTIKKSFLI